MTSNDLLFAMKEFTEKVISEVLLPVKMQQSDSEQPSDRVATVYVMRLPDSKSSTKKAPYILHQKVNDDVSQPPGKRTSREVTVRSVFCVYDPDEQRGGLSLNELMERFLIGILKERVLAEQYALVMDSGKNPQSVVYPDDTAPYYIGEMVTVWSLPPVEREVRLHEQYEDHW